MIYLKTKVSFQKNLKWDLKQKKFDKLLNLLNYSQTQKTGKVFPYQNCWKTAGTITTKVSTPSLHVFIFARHLKTSRTFGWIWVGITTTAARVQTEWWNFIKSNSILNRMSKFDISNDQIDELYVSLVNSERAMKLLDCLWYYLTEKPEWKLDFQLTNRSTWS